MGDRGMCSGAAGSGERVGGGGPVGPVLGGSGVSTWTGPVNFVALSAGRDTIIQRVVRNGGVVERTRLIRGHYGIPGAAYDGSTTGLSADGRTLVLAEFTRSTARTRLLVLDTRHPARAQAHRAAGVPLRRRDLTRRPDALRAALSEGARGRTIYDVMALDLRTGRLRGEPIMDPREPDEKMGGIPLTRTMSPDMRWVYTLYSGEHNFVHALDTQEGTARCIDLPGGDLSAERLALDGPTLQVGDVGDDRPAHVHPGQGAGAPGRHAAGHADARTRQGRRRRSRGCRWRSGSSRWRPSGCSPAGCAPTGRSRSRSRCRPTAHQWSR